MTGNLDSSGAGRLPSVMGWPIAGRLPFIMGWPIAGRLPSCTNHALGEEGEDKCTSV
jgi:hypothetical protein